MAAGAEVTGDKRVCPLPTMEPHSSPERRPAPPPAAKHPLLVPDLGLLGMPLVLSLWLVPEGSLVLEGDRVVELLAGGATIDLEAPVTGRLAAQLIDEDAGVSVGAVLAEFVAAQSDEEEA